MAEASAYAILGVPKGSSDEEIKRAYVEMVKKYDPERHTERFMVIQAAYNRLKSIEHRAKEDIHTLNFIRGEFLFDEAEQSADNSPPEQSKVNDARQALRQNPGDPRYRDALGLVLLQRARYAMLRKQWPDAIRDWKEVLEMDPGHARARQNLLNGYITLGTTYALHGLDEEAIELWEKAISMSPDNVELLHNLAITLEKRSDPAKAGRYWAETVKRWTRRMESGGGDSDYFRFCIIEATRHHGGQIDNANESQSTRQQQAPSAPSPASRPGSMPSGSSPAVPKPGMMPQKSTPPESVSASGEDNTRVIARLRKMLDLNPNDVDSRFQLVHKLMDDGSYTEALSELQTIQKAHPKNMEVVDLMAWSHLNAGQVDAAFGMWNKGLSADPKDGRLRESLVRARLMVGKQLRDKGLFTHALVHFKSLLRLLPNSAEVHLEIAATYDMKGDVRSAQQEYQAVLALDPKNKVARKAINDLRMKR